MMTPAAFAASFSEPPVGPESNDSQERGEEPVSDLTAHSITDVSTIPTPTTTESGLWISRS
jgi:hypothetical protein